MINVDESITTCDLELSVSLIRGQLWCCWVSVYVRSQYFLVFDSRKFSSTTPFLVSSIRLSPFLLCGTLGSPFPFTHLMDRLSKVQEFSRTPIRKSALETLEDVETLDWSFRIRTFQGVSVVCRVTTLTGQQGLRNLTFPVLCVRSPLWPFFWLTVVILTPIDVLISPFCRGDSCSLNSMSMSTWAKFRSLYRPLVLSNSCSTRNRGTERVSEVLERDYYRDGERRRRDMVNQIRKGGKTHRKEMKFRRRESIENEKVLKSDNTGGVSGWNGVSKSNIKGRWSLGWRLT